MSQTETIFKIRNKADGLFSSGGMDPSWSKKGKRWRGIGPLKNHLNLIKRRVYAGCEVVEIEVTFKETSNYLVADLLDARDKKRADEIADRKAQRLAEEENRKRQLARQLIKEFGVNP
jgi:hypothetical protein